jgi:outer membrane protein
MVVSTRAIAAVVLGGLGVAFLVGPSLAQPPQDAAVRKAATQATAPKPPAPATIGCVDMGAVFKGYDKVKVTGDEFKGAVLSKQNELVKLQSEAQQEQDTLAKLTPGSIDHKKHEDRISELKAKYEASREQYQREFALREAETLATLYKEIQSMVGRIAQFRGMTYVVRVSNDPVNGSNPNSPLMAIERTIVYADPRNDITNDVIFNLNREYKALGGTTPKPSSGNAAPAAGSPGNPPGPGGN